MTTEIVKLSSDTIEILKNIATINNSLKFQVGDELKTISSAGTIIMEAKIKESFPREFSIYELSKFLNVLSLPNMRDAELVFADDEKVKIKSSNSEINYFFTEQSFITHPDKIITLPSIDLDTVITEETFDNFQKAANALSHKILILKAKDEQISLIATTPDIDTSNDYIEDLGAIAGVIDGEYQIRVDNLKMLAGEYRVEVCAAGIAKFTHTTRPITYYLGLERQ